MDELLTTMKTAQDAHAACLKYSFEAGRMVQTVCDLELNARHAECIAAEKAYAKACRKGNR